MTTSDPEFAARRTARNRARADLYHLLGQAKADFAPAVLKRRMIAEAKQSAMTVTHRAVDIASDSRGVIAGTAAVLVVWLARKPILAGFTSLRARFQPRTPAARAKLLIADYWQKLKEYADE